ncbi:hypothetical protein DYB31_002456 [Aphanomyces astaci]|uniref:BCAS3 domain-containing protein n=1 Tax=Aphanomyces astaci TaxID=112090 RepID=A0A397FXT2_APHAT|nr:hypothetical protein DYB31_002456 [Aphanomyces astaci]
MEDVINTNPGALDNWTSYIFPSPSKSPSSPVHVTCLELHQVPHTRAVRGCFPCRVVPRLRICVSSLHEIPFPSPIADILDIQVNASVAAVLTHHTIRLLDRRLNYTVSRGEGGHLAVRDCISHTCIASFEAHSSAITSIAFDPSGMLVVSSSDKGQTLHVHRVQDGALLYRLHRGITHARIRHVATYAIRPDGGAIGGHTHAAVDLNDPTHLAVAKASIADEVQAKRFLLGGTETLHPLARLRHSSVDTVGSGLVCCHWHASHLLVASGGFLKALAVKPRSNVVDAPKPWLVLSLHLDVAKQRELDPRSSTTLPRFTDPIKPNGPAVETVTHVHHDMPIWHHPKVTFRALSWGKFRVLNVKRLGPVPLSTDDVVLEQLTQGESPVFDGTPSRDEPFVPPLDLSGTLFNAMSLGLLTL